MYALGCLYYYALTGKHPFTGDSAAEVMISHLQHHVTPLIELRPDIPQWAADWIMWHLERQMDQRPMDAHEALKRFLAHEKQATQPVPTATLLKATSPVTPVTTSQTANPISVARTSSSPITLATATTPTATPIAAPAANPTAANPVVKQQAMPVEPSPAPTLKVQPAPAQNSAAIVKPVATIPLQAATTQLKAATPASASAKLAAKPMTAQPSTPGNESQRPDDSGLGFESAKKTMPTGAKWALISMLLVVIVVTAIVGTSVMDERKYTKMVNDVMVKAKALDDEDKLGVDGIELTEEELRGTLNRATSMDENKQQAILLKTLLFAKATGGYDADAIILDHTLKAKCPSSIRAGLFRDVIRHRGNAESIAALIEFARNSTQEDAAAGAIDAARSCAIDQQADVYVKDLVNLIKSTDSAKIRMAAEKTIHVIIGQSDEKASFEPDIYDIYKNTTDDNIKFTMLRLLGTTGEDMALDAIDDALESGEPTDQAAAIAALAKWKNDSQFPKLISYIKDEKDRDLRANAFNQALTFLVRDRQRESDQLQGLWESVAGLAETRRDKEKIIAGLAIQSEPWAITMLQSYLKDPDDDVSYAAERAIEKIEKNISQNKKQDEKEDE
jgi:HEAT repeat protein